MLKYTVHVVFLILYLFNMHFIQRPLSVGVRLFLRSTLNVYFKFLNRYHSNFSSHVYLVCDRYFGLYFPEILENLVSHSQTVLMFSVCPFVMKLII